MNVHSDSVLNRCSHLLQHRHYTTIRAATATAFALSANANSVSETRSRAQAKAVRKTLVVNDLCHLPSDPCLFHRATALCNRLQDVHLLSRPAKILLTGSALSLRIQIDWIGRPLFFLYAVGIIRLAGAGYLRLSELRKASGVSAQRRAILTWLSCHHRLRLIVLIVHSKFWARRTPCQKECSPVVQADHAIGSFLA